MDGYLSYSAATDVFRTFTGWRILREGGNVRLIRTYMVLLFLGAATAAQAHDDGLPLGDGKLSSSPQVGYLWVCHEQKGGGGAFRDGPWIQGGYWYPDRKINVQGDVAWPDASLSISSENDLRVFSGNDLPTHATGMFPVQQSDPAFNYDRNPNSIRQQSLQFSLPAKPVEAAAPSCTGGAVGISLSGSWIFNGIDAEGRDAPAHEVQDKCNGHPERRGQYHYHGPSPCMKDDSGAAGRHSDQVGYAFDGFGIYGLHGEDGRELTDADLDACHGHKHAVMWNGKMQVIYHYHMTREFPYSVGCFKGSVVNRHAESGQNAQQGQPGPQGESSRPGRMADPRSILEGAARTLGVDPQALRDAVGGPPPDFARASRALGIPEERIHSAFVSAGAPN